MSIGLEPVAVDRAEPDTAAGSEGVGRFEWRTVLRHRLPLRVMHWINLLCMLVLVGSGLQVFNAHPALYWGAQSTFAAPVFATTAVRGPDGRASGITTVGDHRFDTTGVLGVSRRADGMRVKRGFPEWATIPGPRSLALGRRWHFFFAWLWVINGACFLLWSLASRHLSRDLAMQARDWRGIGRSIVEHLRFHHPVGEEATHYNPLQKLAYLGVIFVLAPLAVLTGLSMSPQLASLLGWWLQLVGGRQSARTIHFIVMSLFVAFTVVHVLMVVYAGPINEMRSMLSGRFRVRVPRGEGAGHE
ncbi:cytochrome b/b6 domain-containing protein [Cognatiluteimonas telluris]|uniref:cytochrome b/b6 domain-containing protein n=1 Tax=Cognatiluteimonas telluris TaxID=1104775 RepID=UPI00140C5407|nr:cytochrome b/b6 domain-containing protein [Lysobacter telluris]